jgi:hypothetical protein
MSAALIAPAVRPLTAFESLLLGDLAALLEETPSLTTSRWLLAVLDRLLALRLEGPTADVGELPSPVGPEPEPDLVDKLQRLRDRVAMRAPYLLLANDVRCELRALLAGGRDGL